MVWRLLSAVLRSRPRAYPRCSICPTNHGKSLRERREILCRPPQNPLEVGHDERGNGTLRPMASPYGAPGRSNSHVWMAACTSASVHPGCSRRNRSPRMAIPSSRSSNATAIPLPSGVDPVGSGAGPGGMGTFYACQPGQGAIFPYESGSERGLWESCYLRSPQTSTHR